MSPIERSAGGGGSGFSNPMTTKGDIIIESAAPAPARLAIGSTGQALGVSSGLPAWQWPPGHEFDYAQVTADLTLGAEADWIVGNAVTYDGATRVKIECFCPSLDASGSGLTMGGLIRLYDGVTALNRIADVRGTNTFDDPVYGAIFLTPSAAAHTYKVTAQQVGGVGTQILHAGAVAGGTGIYAPSWLRITQA